MKRGGGDIFITGMHQQQEQNVMYKVEASIEMITAKFSDIFRGWRRVDRLIVKPHRDLFYLYVLYLCTAS